MAKKIKNKEQILDQYTICSLWVVMSGFISLMFVKEVINQNYLIHLYVDSFVAIFAFFVVLHNLKKQYDLLKEFKWITIEIVAYICGLVVVVLTAKTPFDVSFLILVVGMIVSKKMVVKELNKK